MCRIDRQHQIQRIKKEKEKENKISKGQDELCELTLGRTDRMRCREKHCA